ncbi:MAG: Bug family tripartite tricarboxylate transporter substrate binding protein [Geminicoccaceae bacterium]
MSRRDTILMASVAVAAALLAGAPAAPADDFPEDSVEITELFGAGSSSDLTARVVAEGMAAELGVPVVVVNRPGGGGAVGYSHVNSQPATGYDLVWMSDSVLTTYHSGNMDFDYTAFTPIARVCQEVPALAVHTESGWSTFDDFVAAAKERPGEMKVGISGRGSFTHLTSEALFNEAGIEARYVPYGKGNAAVELLGRRIDAALQWPSVFKSHAEAGDLRMLVVTSADPVPSVPDVPTAQDGGHDVNLVLWRGVAAPAGTPAEAVERLEAAVEAAVASEQFKEASGRIGCLPAFLPADEFADFIAQKDQEIASIMEGLEIKKQ